MARSQMHTTIYGQRRFQSLGCSITRGQRRPFGPTHLARRPLLTRARRLARRPLLAWVRRLTHRPLLTWVRCLTHRPLLTRVRCLTHRPLLARVRCLTHRPLLARVRCLTHRPLLAARVRRLAHRPLLARVRRLTHTLYGARTHLPRGAPCTPASAARALTAPPSAHKSVVSCVVVVKWGLRSEARLTDGTHSG